VITKRGGERREEVVGVWREIGCRLHLVNMEEGFRHSSIACLSNPLGQDEVVVHEEAQMA
jgi:hypothetical protein